MDSVKRSSSTPKKGRLARTIAKVLHIRAATGIAPVDGIHKVKSPENVKDNLSTGRRSRSVSQSFTDEDNDEKLQNKAAMEAVLAKLFATISSIKAAYAQIQISQSPYDADGIQSADQILVSELKSLSELKQCFLKKQFDSSPETTLVMAEIQEQSSLLKTYEIMRKKLESQLKLKSSEIEYLREKLGESSKQNKSIEKRLNASGQLTELDNLHLSGLNPTHFSTVLRHTIKSIRTFVRLMVIEMKSANWDFDAAATAIVPGVVYWKANHRCFAVESFICLEMFRAFHQPNFSLPNESLPEQINKRKQLFFNRFNELKAVKAKEILTQKPKSTFAKFCRFKYLQLVHPEMEVSFFGNLNQRNSVSSGEFPDTPFFASFAEMAKRVWLLHCLACSFSSEPVIFQVKKNCQFSEVYMESVADEAFIELAENDLPESNLQVAFTVVPGFKIGKTVLQCQVYLSKQNQTELSR